MKLATHLHGDTHGVAEVDHHKGDDSEELLLGHRHLAQLCRRSYSPHHLAIGKKEKNLVSVLGH